MCLCSNVYLTTVQCFFLQSKVFKSIQLYSRQDNNKRSFWPKLEHIHESWIWMQCAGHYCKKNKKQTEWFLTIAALIKCMILLDSDLYVCDTLWLGDIFPTPSLWSLQWVVLVLLLQRGIISENKRNPCTGLVKYFWRNSK